MTAVLPRAPYKYPDIPNIVALLTLARTWLCLRKQQTMAEDNVFNVFRILGDVSHTASKCILIWAIHTNSSAEGKCVENPQQRNHSDCFIGVSLITQILYALVFVTRYLNIFWVSPTGSTLHVWNFVLKNFYIISSFYIIYLMMRIFARTREREKAWRLGGYCLGGSIILAPIATAMAEGKKTGIVEILWTFSIILESLCVVPQLLLLRQTTVPTVIDSFYLLTLGSYRAFYILNWTVRVVTPPQHHFEWRAVLFGIIQTAFYVDFAWVYWSRQRVKLRNGGVVDSDDLSRGFLVSRVLGRNDAGAEDEERAGPDSADHDSTVPAPAKGASWGARGISVSADDGVVDSSRKTNIRTQAGDVKATNDGLSGLTDDDSEDEILGPHHQANRNWQ